MSSPKIFTNDNVKEFLINHISLIDNERNDFESLYQYAHKYLFDNDVGLMTQILLKVGYNPLQYLKEIPDSYAWGMSELTTFTIPSHIDVINQSSFKHCRNLKQITIPASICIIGDQAFNNCVALESVTFQSPNKLRTICYESFGVCTSLTSIKLPEGLRTIEQSTFSNCYNLKDIYIPESVTSIEETVFMNCPQSLVIKCKKDSYADKYAQSEFRRIEYVS